MATTPRLTMRALRQVELVMATSPSVMSFSVGGANTLDAAFAGTTELFQVRNGGTYRSKSIKDRGLGRTYYSNRGLTRTLFDFEDFWVGGGSLPHDAHTSYVRVSEISPGGAVLSEGPIFVVPPPTFFSSPRPALSLVGTAPSVTPLATRLPPTGAMHIALPKFTDNIRVRNTSGAAPLFIAFGEGSVAVQVPISTTETFLDAATADIFVYGNGATVTFEMTLAIVNGEMA